MDVSLNAKYRNRMKNFKSISVALIATTLSFISCGFGPQGTTTGNTNNNAALEAGVGVLGALLTGGNTTDATTSLLTGVIGSLLDNAQSGSIIGTWVYAEPSVEFTSQNLLAQAGGMIAANQAVSKLAPYYEIRTTHVSSPSQAEPSRPTTPTTRMRTHCASPDSSADSHSVQLTSQYQPPRCQSHSTHPNCSTSQRTWHHAQATQPSTPSPQSLHPSQA